VSIKTGHIKIWNNDEQVRFDAFVLAAEDRAHTQVILQFLERRLDFGELDVNLPRHGRVVFAEIAALQKMAFAPTACSGAAKNPITGVAGFCAQTVGATIGAVAMRPTRLMKSRRFIE
jgi:hypothetical protein